MYEAKQIQAANKSTKCYSDSITKLSNLLFNISREAEMIALDLAKQ